LHSGLQAAECAGARAQTRRPALSTWRPARTTCRAWRTASARSRCRPAACPLPPAASLDTALTPPSGHRKLFARAQVDARGAADGTTDGAAGGSANATNGTAGGGANSGAAGADSGAAGAADSAAGGEAAAPAAAPDRPDEKEGAASTAPGLQEPEDNEIRTVHAGDTPYTSAASFDDLPISQPLLQARAAARGRACGSEAAGCCAMRIRQQPQ